MSKSFVGVRLQRLREERGISQIALSKILKISPSYLNQIEHNQRPLTVPILLKISAQLSVDVQVFSDDEEAQLIADMRDVIAEAGGEPISVAEMRALASNMPAVARTMVALHHRARIATERADTVLATLGDGQHLSSFNSLGLNEQVRDYFNRRQNYVAELDEAAEAIFYENRVGTAELTDDLSARLLRRLYERHGVRVLTAPDDASDDKQRYDGRCKVLYLADSLRPGQQAFQMAILIAGLEMSEVLDSLVSEGGFRPGESERLARIGVANYFAGALVMPYNAFLQAAAELSYDIERLSSRFRVGFEAVCHRLSTLQRPNLPGLPFFFVRVDRAGNISKRHSAAGLHFSHVGGTCPLWIVYEAFSHPERTLTQIARMPDGRSYFWLARQVVSGPVGHGRPLKTFAIGLGCDLRHAHRLVYSRGLELSEPGAATLIGPGCKVCERQNCSQRAQPLLLVARQP